MKPYIDNIIVVEGIRDKNKILSYIDAKILVSNGKNFNFKFLKFCKKLNNINKLILFFDSDEAGYFIRKKFYNFLKNCYNVFLPIKKKYNNFFVEKISKKDLFFCLKKFFSLKKKKKLLKKEFNKIFLLSNKKKKYIKKIGKILDFPTKNINTKKCFLYLNLFLITKKKCLEMLNLKDNESF